MQQLQGFYCVFMWHYFQISSKTSNFWELLRIAENYWEFSNQFRNYLLLYLHSFIHSNWNRTIRHRSFSGQNLPNFLTWGSPGKNFKSKEPEGRSEAERGEASPLRLRRLKNFPRGPPLRAEKWILGFHKNSIQGVFSLFRPGHLLKKPRTFTGFFSKSSIFSIFSLFFPSFFPEKSPNDNFFFLQIP